MKTPAAAGALALAFAACLPALAQDWAPVPETGPLAGAGKSGAPPAIRLNEELIRQAVRETIKESRDARKSPVSDSVLSARKDGYAEFGRQFSEAQVPGCFGPDPLKHVPTGMVIRSRTLGDWLIGVGGVFAAPFWGYAALTGKCK